MSAHRYVEENGSAAMLATKKSAGVAPNLRERVTRMPLLSADKAAHSGDIKVQNRGISGPPKNSYTHVHNVFQSKKKNSYKSRSHCHAHRCLHSNTGCQGNNHPPHHSGFLGKHPDSYTCNHSLFPGNYHCHYRGLDHSDLKHNE